MIYLLMKSRKPLHPLNTPYRQKSGRMVIRVLRRGKSVIIPVPKKKKKNKAAHPKTKHQASKSVYLNLPLSKVEAAEDGQIRKKFDKKEIESLAAGIESAGLIAPIVVRPHPTKSGKYEIIAGERRVRALKLLHQMGSTAKNLPVGHVEAKIEYNIDDIEKDSLQHQENIQRQDNTPMELANGIKKQFDKGISFEDIARGRGKKIDFIKNHYSLTTLDPDIQYMIEKGDIPKKAGYMLSELSLNEQRVFAGKYVNEKWSVSTLGNHIFNHKNQQQLFAPGSEKTDEMLAAEKELAGKSPEEHTAYLRNVLLRNVVLMDKFAESDSMKLSSLGLIAAGTLDQNLKLFEMVQDRLAQIISRLKQEHHNLTAPSMFAKSKSENAEALKTFERLQKDFSILKSLKILSKKNAVQK